MKCPPSVLFFRPSRPVAISMLWFVLGLAHSAELWAASRSLPALTALAPPSIIVEPAPRITTVGVTATFSVTATGTAPLAYQWRFNEAELTGKTARTLGLSNVQLSDAGNYSVTVTNPYGAATSRVAALMFTTAHRFEKITMNPDRSVSLSIEGVVPSAFAPYYDIYPIERSANLVDWSPFITLLRTNNSTETLNHRDVQPINLENRFYRTQTNFLVTPFPKPTGPYPVGTVSRLLTDPSRTNRYNVPANSSFVIQLWYPAQASAGALPERWLEHQVIEADPSYWGPKDPANLAKLFSHAVPGVPLATNQTSFPVVLYSPPFSGRRGNTDKALELASHGYIVVAVDHITVLASVFPNGQVFYGTTLPDGPNLKTRFIVPFENGIKDLRFVLAELNRLNAEDTFFSGRLDIQRMGAFGFSLGSVFAAEFCRIEPLCKAVVIFDSGYVMEGATNLTEQGLQKPFLFMNSTGGWIEPSPGFGPWLASATNLFAKATTDAFWFQLQDSRHQSFNDKGSLVNNPTLTGDPTATSTAQSEAIRACMLSFFDKYLKGEDDRLLDNPPAVFPNIINFKRK